MTFTSSKEVMLLQLADFAAFCLNRTQLIINREELSDLDITFLEICSDFPENYKNIQKGYLNL